MTFNTQEITPEYIGIIDIGTSKIRVWVCAIKNREIDLLWYGEKRQDRNDIVMQEIHNIAWVCENIELALNRAQQDAEVEVEKLFINLPSSEIFMESSQINFIRKTSQPINDLELYDIMTQIEKQALKKHWDTIKQQSGYARNELRLIMSNISNILVDGAPTKQLLWYDPEQIHISTSNVYIPTDKAEVSEYIEDYLGKKIIQIIPTEYSLLELFSNIPSIVLIDIWCTHTSVIIKHNHIVLGVKKLVFWMDDLIKTIIKKHRLSRGDIIAKIDENIFLPEKAQFLQVFNEILAIALQETLDNKICPHEFFMSGGGANSFIKQNLLDNNLQANGVKIPKQIEFIIPKVELMSGEDESWVDKAKSNINIFSMISCCLNFVKKQKSPLETIVSKIIKELEK